MTVPVLTELASLSTSSQWVSICFILTVPPIRGREVLVTGGLLYGKDLAVLEIPNTGGEAEALQVAHRKNLVCIAFSVYIMFLYVQVGFVVEKPVEDVGRVPDACVYDLLNKTERTGRRCECRTLPQVRGRISH